MTCLLVGTSEALDIKTSHISLHSVVMICVYLFIHSALTLNYRKDIMRLSLIIDEVFDYITLLSYFM